MTEGDNAPWSPHDAGTLGAKISEPPAGRDDKKIKCASVSDALPRVLCIHHQIACAGRPYGTILKRTWGRSKGQCDRLIHLYRNKDVADTYALFD